MTAIQSLVRLRCRTGFSKHDAWIISTPAAHGVAIGKDAAKSPHKIDAAVAACLAWQARHDYMALPESKRYRKRSNRAMFV